LNKQIGIPPVGAVEWRNFSEPTRNGLRVFCLLAGHGIRRAINLIMAKDKSAKASGLAWRAFLKNWDKGLASGSFGNRSDMWQANSTILANAPVLDYALITGKSCPAKKNSY